MPYYNIIKQITIKSKKKKTKDEIGQFYSVSAKGEKCTENIAKTEGKQS